MNKGVVAMREEIKGKIVFEQDSKRFHRFKIQTDSGIVGSVYIPKKIERMPKKLILHYADKE